STPGASRADLGDLLEQVESELRYGRREERCAAALDPQHRLAVDTAAEHVTPVDSDAGPRHRTHRDRVCRVGRAGRGVAQEAARRAWARCDRADVEVG